MPEPEAAAKPTVWMVRQKRQRGEPLTEDEREVERATNAKYAKNRKAVYAPDGDLEALEEEALAKGMTFSAYVLWRANQARMGDSAAVKQLESEVNRLRIERDNIQGLYGRLTMEKAEDEARIKDLEKSTHRVADTLTELRKILEADKS